MGVLIKTARKLESTARLLRKISKVLKGVKKEIAEFKGVCKESWHDAMAKQAQRMFLIEKQPEHAWEY